MEVEFLEDYSTGISPSPLAKKRPKEVRDKIRNTMLGVKYSNERRRNMSLARIGKRFKPLSEEHKQKLRIGRLGKKLSDEHKCKLSQVKIGKKLSESHKNNMRLSALQRVINNNGKFPMIGKNETMLLDRQEKIDNCNIVRQYVICSLGYVVDGYCVETNTVYEVYENHHAKQIENDMMRQDRIIKYLHCNFLIIWDVTCAGKSKRVR
jgi:very-short-patch-repair endonuclease